ncbi:MAG: 50S ribosomal protein L25 [Flavobacteriales bacterium]|jgi:large subunit ribosomal protein L25
MKQIALSGSPRGNVGRQEASELRRTGHVPGVIYGGGKQHHFSVDAISLNKILSMPDTLQVNLEINGTSVPTIIQEIQRHPVTDKVVHIDMLELVPGKPVKTTLPVRTTGNSEGVRAGGRLSINYRKVRIFGNPESLPEEIVVDITPLKIGDMVRVRELNVPGCTLLEADASAVVSIEATRASIAAAQADKPADTKKKK